MNNKVVNLNNYRNRWEEIYRHNDDESRATLRIYVCPRTSEIEIFQMSFDDKVSSRIKLPMTRGVGLMMALENFFDGNKK